MTTQEVRELIEKSRQRVRDMKELNISTRDSEAYHFGYQNALLDVLAILSFEESDPERE